MTKYKPNTSIFGMSNIIDFCPTGYDYEQYQLNELENENMKLKKQLEIAVKALNKAYNDMEYWSFTSERNRRVLDILNEALKEIDLVNTSAKEEQNEF